MPELPAVEKLKRLSPELQPNLSLVDPLRGDISHQNATSHHRKTPEFLPCSNRRRLLLGVHSPAQNHDGSDLIDDIPQVLPPVACFVISFYDPDQMDNLLKLR